MSKARLGWGVLGVVWLVAACGKADGAGPVARDELPGRIAAIQCESVAACCKQLGQQVDVAGCKSALTSELRSELAEEYRVSTTYDAQAGGECVAEAAANVDCGDIKGHVPACERLFVGTLPLGAACQSGEQCQDPVGGAAICDSGVCKAQPPPVHGKTGDACTFSCGDDDDCLDYPRGTEVTVACYRSEGLYCGRADEQSNTRRCQPLAAMGQACDPYEESCVAGAVCPSPESTCVAPKPNGASCGGSGECQSGHCDGHCIDEPGLSARDCAPG